MSVQLTSSRVRFPSLPFRGGSPDDLDEHRQNFPSQPPSSCGFRRPCESARPILRRNGCGPLAPSLARQKKGSRESPISFLDYPAPLGLQLKLHAVVGEADVFWELGIRLFVSQVV